MIEAVRSIFDHNLKQLRELRLHLQDIKKHQNEVKNLKDADFPIKTNEMRQQLQDKNQTLDHLLPYAYALCQEAARRTLGFAHFDEQLMAGVALHQGKIVEQKTGEGKTLTATLPLYLNALAGQGVHLVTVNDYLARRDAGWMGQLFHFLGVSTATIISDKSYIYDAEHTDATVTDWRLAHLRSCSRRAAYEADITYGINSEFGFDYLRDNMANRKGEIAQRNFYFAIIDEADSILIDEARTPHIISAPYDEDTSRYHQYARWIRQLNEATDYKIDEKLKTVHLTDAGIIKIEQILGVDNIYEKDFQTLFHVEAALKAQTLYHKDKDYIIRDNEVVIVDEFTGRLLFGRRFSEGLHQALEAKENVVIKRESRTLATVSLQNYFRAYKKLAGMTGTALTEAQEFIRIYKTDVVAIPTHRAMARRDHPDMIYKTEKAKFNAVADDIAQAQAQGRPVLAGTTSIQKNEHLSQLLTRRGIKHQLLNAKHHEQEAQIIAEAGRKSAVTVATNMAGRGVDIILGGEPPNEFTTDKSAYEKAKAEWQRRHDEVIELGGLYVIGTERHESRRIDNQLRGRSGRQGDPGDTRFFVSMEDDLMRIFGGEQISKIMAFLNFPEDQPLSHGMVSKAIEQSQVKVEGFNFDMRKHLVDYDDVLNRQREIVYSLRRRILLLPEESPDNFEKVVKEFLHQQIEGLISACQIVTDTTTEEELELVTKDITLLFPTLSDQVKKTIRNQDFEQLDSLLKSRLNEVFDRWNEEIGREHWHQIIKHLSLEVIDQHWTEHLTAIDNLREGINLRGYAQVDPLVAYKNEAFSMFEQLINSIYGEILAKLTRIQIEAVQKSEEDVSNENKKLNYQSAAAVSPFTKQADHIAQPQQQPVLSADGKRPGRNDPCPCGSGKKYKKCCGR